MRLSKGLIGDIAIVGSILAILTIVILVLSACSGTHGSSPAPENGGVQPVREKVVQQPYGFRNWSVSCNGSTGVYVTSDSSAQNLPSGIAVVANDPYCVGIH